MKKLFTSLLLLSAALFAVAGDGFMSEHWNQTSPWNDYMPSYLPADEYADTGMEAYKYRAPAGCVATAMAQVLDYWQWPKRYLTFPRHYHTHPVGVQEKYAFSLEIYLDGHEPFLFDGSSKDMAHLTYLCASLGNLDFNRSGTGGNPGTVAANLKDYYVVRSDLKWDDIKVLIEKKFPIAATIKGHAIVLHGWQGEGEKAQVYTNQGYSGDGDRWMSINDILTTTICYPKKKVVLDPIRKSYPLNPSISWSFPAHYEDIYKDEFKGFKLSVFVKGEKSPMVEYEVAPNVRNYTFDKLDAGAYTVEITPLFEGVTDLTKGDPIEGDSCALVIVNNPPTELSMSFEKDEYETSFTNLSFKVVCKGDVTQVNVFPNITEFTQQPVGDQAYQYCYVKEEFSASLQGSTATVAVNASNLPRRLKGQNIILTIQAVDKYENEVYKDILIKLIKEGSGTDSGTEGTDPEEKPEGTDPDPGTETDPTNYIKDSDGADYILISPSDFVDYWTPYVKARAKAHPELKFAIKNAAEIYAAYKDLNPSEKIKEYIKSKVPDGKGTKYIVLGGAWSDPATIEKSDESFVVPGVNGDKYGQVALSLDNTIPGYKKTFSGKTLATDYPYSLVDGDEKPDVVISRIPLVPWPKADGSVATFAEMIAGYGKKVAEVESAAFAGTHRYACAGAQLGTTVKRGGEYWPTERHAYADGYYDFFDPRHPDSVTDGMIAARRRFRDYFAMYNPVKGAMVIPVGNAATDFFADEFGWEAIVAKCHGLEGEAYETGITDARFRETSTIIKFGVFAMPCLTGRPDRTTTWNEWSNLRYPSMGVAAICNPDGGEVVGFHNTHDGAGKNDVALVTTCADPYATQYEGYLLTRLCNKHLNAGLAWKLAHEDYVDKHGTGTWHLWTAYESLLYGDPLVEMSAVNEPVCGKGSVPAKVLFK